VKDPGRATLPTERGDDGDDVRGLAIGASAGGWFLLTIVGPLAVFLTWFGDCVREPCPVASDLDRAIYTADLVAWVAFPVLAFAAYRGWRPASYAIVAVGIAILAQGIASILGARGFQAFFFVLPAGGLIALGGTLGLDLPALRGASRGPAVGSRVPAGVVEIASLGFLSTIVVALALQGFAGGIGGVVQGLVLAVAVILLFIAIAAMVNRRRANAAPDRPPLATRGPRRRPRPPDRGPE
jgi:hypothetical protein